MRSQSEQDKSDKQVLQALCRKRIKELRKAQESSCYSRKGPDCQGGAGRCSSCGERREQGMNDGQQAAANGRTQVQLWTLRHGPRLPPRLVVLRDVRDAKKSKSAAGSGSWHGRAFATNPLLRLGPLAALECPVCLTQYDEDARAPMTSLAARTGDHER